MLRIRARDIGDDRTPENLLTTPDFSVPPSESMTNYMVYCL